MYFVDSMLIVLALGIGMLLREARRTREEYEPLCDDADDDLTPLTIVRYGETEDRRVN